MVDYLSRRKMLTEEKQLAVRRVELEIEKASHEQLKELALHAYISLLYQEQIYQDLVKKWGIDEKRLKRPERPNLSDKD